MTRLTTLDFPAFSRATVGFDKLFNELERTVISAKNSSYPPYNIIEINENEYLIEIAVAGFDRAHFDIEVHKNILSVRADIKDSDAGTKYIHKGIAARNFERSFTLAETVEIDSVNLKRGMLSIKLVNRVPEELQPKKIAIEDQS